MRIIAINQIDNWIDCSRIRFCYAFECLIQKKIVFQNLKKPQSSLNFNLSKLWEIKYIIVCKWFFFQNILEVAASIKKMFVLQNMYFLHKLKTCWQITLFRNRNYYSGLEQKILFQHWAHVWWKVHIICLWVAISWTWATSNSYI